jgi:hypothetical protein
MSEPQANIHASCVAIGNQGVLLLGPSGCGKSDLALRLIDGGATLVSDDRTILFVVRGVLRAKAPPSIKGLLEIRGVGIVQMPVRASAPVTLVVKLDREGARLPGPAFYKPPAVLKPLHMPPQITLDAFFAATPAKIRTACAAYSQGLFRDTFITK